eukprot:9470840-Pyramimonas_sp.AAC.1
MTSVTREPQHLSTSTVPEHDNNTLRPFCSPSKHHTLLQHGCSTRVLPLHCYVCRVSVRQHDYHTSVIYDRSVAATASVLQYGCYSQRESTIATTALALHNYNSRTLAAKAATPAAPGCNCSAGISQYLGTTCSTTATSTLELLLHGYSNAASSIEHRQCH